MQQLCVECQQKDEKIAQLEQRIQELEDQLESFCPQFSQMRGLDEEQQKIVKDNIQKALGNLIGQQNHRKENIRGIQRSVTSNHTEFQQIIEEQHTYIGQRFFEHFLIIGPSLEELKSTNENEALIKPTILYQFPNVNQDLYGVIPDYAFPSRIQCKKIESNKGNFNEKILPELKQIIMQTLQLTKGDNEFVFTIPREDIQNRSQMTVSEFVKETNPNIFRYIVCFQINEFICLDQNSMSCWLCPIVHCFVSYYPFMKFFLKENATIWNSLKLERIEPCLCENTSQEVLKRDFLFMKNKLKTIVNRLFELRSIKVEYDLKYKLNDIQILTPKKEQAKLIQYLWGSEQTFQLLSFKELIYLITHILLSQRVILFCKKRALLSHVMLTVISLLQPFNYQLPFCIYLPDELMDRVAAPCPFFFGVLGDYATYGERIEEAQQDDITYFDLNTKKVYFSKDQSRDLRKLIAPIKKNTHLRQIYHLINNSKDNAFKQIGKQIQKPTKIEKNASPNLNIKEIEKDIAKTFYHFWYSTISQYIPVDRKFIKSGTKTTINLQLIYDTMLQRCPKDARRFVKQFIQNPTFTGYLDEIPSFFKFSKIRFFVQSELDSQVKLLIDAKEGEILAKELKKHKVPLPFECGFSCSCSTCSVLLPTIENYNALQTTQPQSEEEINVLKTEGKSGKVRLSCQLKVTKELEGLTLLI